ncbi:MAG: methyltransferase, partial [Gallionella sp.]|nr:methyltransferase [Gallionella sp.]
TDDAIKFALHKQAKFIVLVPCCQAEVAAQLNKNKNQSFGKTPLSEIWRHPIHTREFGSQLTNVLRCLQLEAHGYQVTVTELVGWEHSMKNELIIATNRNAPRKNAQERLEKILNELNLEELRGRFVY